MIKVLNVGTVPTVCYIFVVRIYAFKGHGYNKGHNKVPIRVISIIRKSSNPNRPHNNKINVEIYNIAKPEVTKIHKISSVQPAIAVIKLSNTSLIIVKLAAMI